VEVVGGAKDEGLALLDALDLVGPLAGDLDGRLDGLGARVHGQHHVEAEQAADLLGPDGEHVVVEGARAQRQPAGLFGEGLDQLRVAVALVDGAVGREEVEVVLVLRVPDVDPLGARKHDGERVVVVGGVLVLGGDGSLGRGGVVPVLRRAAAGAAAADGGEIFVCVGRHCALVLWYWRCGALVGRIGGWWDVAGKFCSTGTTNKGRRWRGSSGERGEVAKCPTGSGDVKR